MGTGSSTLGLEDRTMARRFRSGLARTPAPEWRT